jgi:hypothetical protein
MKKPLLFLILISLLVMRMPQPAAHAATAPANTMTESEAVELLRFYDIVRGEPGGALNLTQKVTRAQAATLFVRTQGAEEYARAVADLVPFYDAKGHWAAGEITLAQRMGLMMGDGDGGFRPDADITYAEVLTVLLRMLGQEPQGDWPRAVMGTAGAFGIVPPGTSPMESAVRGKIFWSLALVASRIPLATGETILQKYIDPIPPDLWVTAPAAVVPDSYVTIKGTATNGAASVTAGGKSATLSKTGDFSARVDLNVGPNQILVEALDHAGNKATETVLVERRPPISRIEVTGPAKIKAGAATQLDIKAFYAQNVAAPADQLDAAVTGDVATFDPVTASLVAGTKLGKGTLTLSSGRISKSFSFEVTGPSTRARQLQINGLVNGALTMDRETTVTVRVLDGAGALVKDDNWRSISLSVTGMSGLTITPAVAETAGGEATFTLVGSQEGSGTLTAVSAGLTVQAVPVAVMSPVRVVLTASPGTLSPDGSSAAKIRATLQNEFGKTVSNTTPSDIRLLLTASGTGTLDSPTINIRPGASYAEATFRAGIVPETVTITGYVQSEQRYSVQPLTLPVTGSLPGNRLQVTGPTGQLLPGDTPATITVRVLDTQEKLVTASSYAFQFSVTTSNGEPIIGGLPEGVQLTFPDTTYRPVDDGRADYDPLNDVNAVVGRTQSGTATLHLRYNKSGTVTLTPRLVGPTQDGYNNTSGQGPAIGSTGMTAQPVVVQFSAEPARIELTVDSPVGRGLPGGALSAGTATLRARVLDRDGNMLPGFTGNMVLTRGNQGNAATEIVGVSQKAPANGIAAFTVQTSGTLQPGFDTYTVTAGALTSNQVTVSVRDRKAPTPVIAAIRGVADGNPSPTTGYVGPDDDYMDIQLDRQDPPNLNEPANWVAATVYHMGETQPLVTAVPVDLKSELPVIRIPKSQLRVGLSAYEVVINNGAGNSDRSPDWGTSQSLNTIYNSNYTLRSALLDAATGRLYISTTGLAATGQLALEKFTMVSPGARLPLDQPGVTVDVLDSTRIIMTLPPEVRAQIDPNQFAGTVTLQTEDGWYVGGNYVARAVTTAAIRPMATIAHALLDEPNGLLYLYGTGFTHGEFSVDQIHVHRGLAAPITLRRGTGTQYDRVTSLSDSRVTIALSPTTLAALLALPAPADPAEVPEAGSDLYLTAGLGWLKLTATDHTYYAAPVQLSAAHPHLIYSKAMVSSVQWDRTAGRLTFTGQGFSGVTIDPAKFAFRGTRVAGEVVPTLSGSGDVQILSDSVFTMTLSQTAATSFDAALNGRDVFVNTDQGWLIDARGRSAAPIPLDSVVFSMPGR